MLPACSEFFCRLSREVSRMRNILRTCISISDGVARVIIWSLTGAMVAIVILQVFMRYVVNAALSWPEELTRYFMIWSGLLASVYAHREGQHVGVALLTDKLRPNGRKIVQVVSHLLIAGFSLLMTWEGIGSLKSYSGISSTALRIRMDIVYSAVPVCFFLLALVSLVAVVEIIRKREG